MNVVIFVGFLGSGKTSLLLPLARFLVELEAAAPGQASVVIIENEVGKVAIDDVVLRREGLDVRELFGGCICCQLTADLTSCLNEIAADVAPGWVLVEATGLGTPQAIVQTINKYGRGIDRVVTLAVVDPERWPELLAVVEPLVTRQVSGADIVLVNKADLVDPAALDEVVESVRGIGPSAAVLTVSVSEGIAAEVWEKVAGW